MNPLKISIKNKEFLEINWDNGKKTSVKLSNLRRNCPCAFCQSAKDEESESYIPYYTSDELEVEHIGIVGNYALNIKWKDGHDTGIYIYNDLIKIARQDN